MSGGEDEEEESGCTVKGEIVSVSEYLRVYFKVGMNAWIN